MTAATLGFVFVIIGLAGFIVLTAIKAWKYAHLPVHSRVELYPVPKEGDGRGKYGGSYFEEEDWWEKPRRLDPVYEVVDIMAEMLLISKLFKHQRSLWWASYAFHLGIYVMFGWSLLLLLTVFWNPEFLVVGTAVVGVVGFALSTAGTVLLLVRRAVDESLRTYTPPQEYFNILLILATLVTGIVAWTFFASPFDVARSVFAFDAAPLPGIVVAHLVLLGLMLLYIPAHQDEPLRGQVLRLPQGAVGQRSQRRGQQGGRGDGPRGRAPRACFLVGPAHPSQLVRYVGGIAP